MNISTKNISILQYLLCCLLLTIFTACSTKSDAVKVRQVEVQEQTEFSGLGIESKDIDSISEKMTADLLQSSFYLNQKTTPIIVLEGTYFINESSFIINTNLLADRMRISLIRQAASKIRFVTRQNLDAIIEEAQTSGSDIDIVEAQYRMTAKIASIHKVSNESGAQSNYFQFSFELLDLQTSAIVWANIYDIKKIGADDSIYR
jgi:PBP1b-binding outer membrane lipoprotein LpoB